MIFDDCPEQFLDYHQSFDSPDLRPISLPMSGYDKSSLEGMINLQAAATAFPDSNAFSQYLQPAYGPHFIHQQAIGNTAPESEQEYFSDSELGYPLEYVEQKEIYTNDAVVNVVPLSKTYPSTQPSKKRKASQSPEYIEPQPRKKATVAQLHLQDPSGEYHDLNQASPYSTYVATPGPNIIQSTGRVLNSPRPNHQYSTSNASQVSLAAPSPHTPAWSPSFTTVKTEHSPRAPMTPAPRPASTSSPYIAHNPKLVRTSTIAQQPSPAINVTMGAGIHTHTFNPYAMYPHNKATLRLKADLDAVGLEWSDEELESRRKLIVFTRSQTGSTIDAEFKTVAPQDWSRSDITVNCIWWKEKKEAFVTSVDTIALLEQLVAVRFTVEEKNRIRRNLEGFRPLTVSKAKPDSEDFFKVIMGFPNPKPRNIEKDVKVFPWKILAHALKKIISKYSASYSSTASAMTTPTTSVYASTENSVDYHYDAPQSLELMPSAMPQCSMPMPCYEPGMVTGRMSASVNARIPDLSLQVPSMGPSYEMIQNGYGYNHMPMVSHPMQMAANSAPVHRMHPGWGYEQYANVPAHMTSYSAPPSAYPRGHIETADFVPPAGYQIHH